MDFQWSYEIPRTVEFIRSRGFSRVALQFPDELLKDSTRVARALRHELGKGVRLYVMADTAYGSCCVDEVGASHVDAECVVHYGHACMSPTSTLPALFIFGKAFINVNACAESLLQCLSVSNKPVLVLYGLEYAHALQDLKSVMSKLLSSRGSNQMLYYSEVAHSSINPSGYHIKDIKLPESHEDAITDGEIIKNGESEVSNKLESGTKYSLGGLTWTTQSEHKMEDHLLFWIGSDNSAFANMVLTFNSCEIVRYDAKEGKLLNDFSQQTRILKRRYFLVEKAKDANIVGIIVGTLGVAGYLHIIQQMKELIEKAGKKCYTIVMGRPNPAKLANFPECDVFVYVSCAQTALLDSKEFLAPVITPFEAVLAFSRGRQWTGEYIMEFQNLMASDATEIVDDNEGARFSFLKGCYVEDHQPQENNGDQKEMPLALAEMTEKALNVRNQCTDSVLFKGTARSGAEYLAARSYQGLNMQYENAPLQSYVVGRTGRASGYDDEIE
ncbi:Diphthamide synthesis DHP2 protein [Dioscorea alata]|uniref:Diphthamide synthesis DHP2 protein n=2 Tax=Dioscorea alata TaxID=55571 RepID=A0ACB7W1E4_DIOAL|nr:Diphthamide synthesis DHP2 protein [Dioscorea alata]